MFVTRRMGLGGNSFGRLLAVSVLLLAGFTTALAQVSETQVAQQSQRLSRIKNEMDLLKEPSNEALNNYLRQINNVENTANGCIQYVQTDLGKLKSELATLGPAKHGEPADVTRKRNSLTRDKMRLQGQIASCRLLLEKSQELTNRITQLQQMRVGQFLLARGPGLTDIVRTNLADPGDLWSNHTLDVLGSAIPQNLRGIGRQQAMILAGLVIFALLLGFGLRPILLGQARTRVFKPTLASGWYRALLACSGHYLPLILISGLITGFFMGQSGENPTLHFISLLSGSVTGYFLLVVVIRALLAPCPPAEPYWPLPASSLAKLGRRLRFLTLVLLLGFVGYTGYTVLAALGLPVYPVFLLARKAFFLLLVVNLIWVTGLLGQLPFLSGTRSVRLMLMLGLLVSLAASWSGYSNLAEFVIRGILVTLSGLALVLLLMRLFAQLYDGLDTGRHRWQRRIRAKLKVKPGDSLPGLIWLRLLTGLLIWGGFILVTFNEWNPMPINTMLIHVGQFLSQWQTWLFPGGAVFGAMIVALIGYRGLFSVARHVAQRPGSAIDNTLIRHVQKPIGMIFPLVAILLVLPALSLRPDIMAITRHLVDLVLIAAIAWLLIGITSAFGDFIVLKYRIEEMDNLRARRIRTQSQVLRRIGIIGVGFMTLAIMLMTFPNVRHLGLSLFASAGMAGLVAGLAARPVLANLIAGVQIALAEPIRIDDVVIVEGEWGWIEEIDTTYVVVRIWDLRRLVIPLSYFIEQPFQNWTRVTADILGTVFVYTDYTVPVEEVRRELRHILESSGMWDGKVCVLQVTNASDHAMELRALMSAPNSGKAWDLRCHVRERLIQFLRERYPESLPRTRADVRGTFQHVDADGGSLAGTPFSPAQE